MLKYRLLVLYPIVDYFLLVEAAHTYVGNSKHLFYQENKDLFKQFQDKIIHVVVDDMPNTKNAWDNETHQRRCISRGLSQIDVNNDDILIISDLDEIVNPDIIKNVKQHGLSAPSRLKMDLYYYNLNTYVTDYNWNAATILSYEQFIKVYNKDSQCVRWGGHIDIENGGWHLCYFGDSKMIQNKIKNFSHTEFSSDYYANIDLIEKKLDEHKDLFDRPDVRLKFIPIEENQNLPPNYNLIPQYISDGGWIKRKQNIIDFAYVTFVNNISPYRELMFNTIRSVEEFSIYPIIVYCVDFPDAPYKNTNKCIVRHITSYTTSPRVSHVYYYKPYIILDALRNGLKTGYYIEADDIITPHADSLKNIARKLDAYPVSPIHPNDVTVSTHYMDNLGVRKTQHYIHAHVLFKHTNIPFIEEWLSNCLKSPFAENYDETALNCTYWKHGLTDHFLGFIGPWYENFYKNKFTREFVASYHGCKDVNIQTKLLDDILSYYKPIPFIFIHLGTEFFPDYVNTALEQCRKWNPTSQIYFVSSSVHKEKCTVPGITCVFTEDIPHSDNHKLFLDINNLDTSFRNGFWKFTTERLFVLEDVCSMLGIGEFFHVENDNMVYFTAEDIKPTLRTHVKGIASPSLEKYRNSFGILYCNDIQMLKNLNTALIPCSVNEMTSGAAFFHMNPSTTFYLPSIPDLHDTLSESDRRRVSSSIQEFGGIFDPAQYGQWLGGIDPRNGESAPYIYSNPAAVITPDKFNYNKMTEPSGLSRYYISQDNHQYPIYVLHIHSKQLDTFK